MQLHQFTFIELYAREHKTYKNSTSQTKKPNDGGLAGLEHATSRRKAKHPDGGSLLLSHHRSAIIRLTLNM